MRIAALPRRVGIDDPGAACRPGQRDGVLRQHAREAEIDDADKFQPRQLGIRLDADDAAIDRGHDAHRHARREDAARAGGDDALADLRPRH